MIATREEAISKLGPYVNRLRSLITAAVSDFVTEVPAERRAWYSGRSRASVIYDAMVRFAKEQLDNVPGVRLRLKGTQLIVYIEDSFELRLKKLNGRTLRPRSYQTQSVKDFMNQQHFEWPDAPPSLTNLVAGYRLNKTQTGLDGVYVICPNGTENAWTIDLSVAHLEALLEAAQAPVDTLPATGQRDKRRKAVPRVAKVKEGTAGDVNDH